MTRNHLLPILAASLLASCASDNPWRKGLTRLEGASSAAVSGSDYGANADATTYSLQANVAYFVSDIVALEATAAWFDTDLDIDGLPDIEYTTATALLGARVYFNEHLYARALGGRSSVRGDVLGVRDSDTAGTVQLGVGYEWKLVPNVTMTVGLQFTRTFDVQLVTNEDDLDTTAVVIGFAVWL